MTRAPAVLLVTTMLVGAVVVGFAAGRLGREADRPDEPSVLGTGELATLTRAPVDVRAERVVLPAGFVSRHRHGGPTFNFVDAGVVVIESAGEQRRYDADGFFFEPGGRVHSITVLEDAQLRVVRLLPPGSEPTTEVP